MEVITSKSNEKVKFIKSLNEKKFRQEHKAFYIEGVKVVNEVINQREAIDILFIAYCDEILKSVNGGSKLLQVLETSERLRNLQLLNISKSVFETITDTKTPQGILAVLKIPDFSIDEILKEEKNVLLLDKLQDLGNIGTIIRSADAFGVKSIICINGTADVYSPKVIRSTMGSILREKIIYIQEEKVEELKKHAHKIVGTSLEARKYVTDFDFPSKCIFVLGNEANGMSKMVENSCDTLVKIKMTGSAESLNVSVAAGIILYEQFNKSTKCDCNDIFES